jgi:hypothetical protein
VIRTVPSAVQDLVLFGIKLVDPAVLGRVWTGSPALLEKHWIVERNLERASSTLLFGVAPYPGVKRRTYGRYLDGQCNSSSFS